MLDGDNIGKRVASKIVYAGNRIAAAEGSTAQKRHHCRFYSHRGIVLQEKLEKAAGSGCASGRKGNQWYLGYKAHIGVNKDSGLVHDLVVTLANVHDATVMPQFLTGDEEIVYEDSGYLGAEKRENALFGTVGGKESNTKTIAARRKSKSSVLAANGMQKGLNTANPRSGQKWNMYSA